MHHDDAYTSEGDYMTTTSDKQKLAEIVLLARRHNNPGVNHGAHRLAAQILAIAEGTPRCDDCGAVALPSLGGVRHFGCGAETDDRLGQLIPCGFASKQTASR